MSSRKKSGSGSGSENLTSTAPRSASTRGAIDCTRAVKRRSGNASATTLATWPSCKCPTKRSSTCATSCSGPASARLSSARPGCTIWPGSTSRASTLASAGAVNVAWASRARAAVVADAARDSCARACATSVPRSALAALSARAPLCCARATVAARCASSKRAALRKPLATKSCVRCNSACAATSTESACATDASAPARPVLRKPARRAAACCSPASACCNAARNSSPSRRTSTSPFLTWAPASTATSSTRPVSVLPTSTRDKVATRPETCSVRTRGATCTVNAGTSAARSDHQASASATKAASVARTHIDRRDMG